ncbi:Bug family tripartite tricarboxylate transporter substrate binding protein [Ottowia thiooxydans]|uniref:Bug family tripartite tricarboxylate transporter substrate binding protein n=1 Tax=Ottowia thiooxydans TaxID=219182 RepID=UPI0003FA8F24|nr:tripartite tricarboxylate transporter substrate binding protein [Ottowia thiooxydans]
MDRRSVLRGMGATGVAWGLGTRSALARTNFPEKFIRLVVPFPAGGVTDISARLLALGMSRVLGQTVVPDNRPGAGGNVAAKTVADSKPDGYTILFATSGSHGINPSLYKNIPFDAVKDFTPIVYTSSSPNIFVANKNFPGKNIADFIQMAQAQPGKLTMGLGSLGTTQHMAAELLRFTSKTDFTTVPYRGGALALQDLMGGTIHTLCDGFPSSLQHVRQGTVKALAVTSKQRVPIAPNIPTVAETLPGFSSDGWFGLVGPAGMDPEIVAALNRAANEALADKDLLAKYTEVGATVYGGTPAAFSQHISTEVARWRTIVQATNAKAE